MMTRVLSMTTEEKRAAEWRSVERTLRMAKEKLREMGLGNQSWMDADIAIAEERAKSK